MLIFVNENREREEQLGLNEFCSNHNFNYEILVVSLMTKQVAVQ